MIKKLLLSAIALSLTFHSWAQNKNEIFNKELTRLQEFFSIPGMSAIVSKDGKIIFENYLGYSNLDTKERIDSETLFPIASITKTFSATLLMQLVEEGKLSLEDPINKYLPESELYPSIQVKHLLSHTSQGDIGEQFFYSSRFGLLTPIIEKASGKSFAELMQEKVLTLAGMNQSFLLEAAEQIDERKVTLASPYILEYGQQEGFVDYGYSASAGLVSTGRELLKFSKALDDNILITINSKDILYSGINPALPYSYGLFSQKVEGMDIHWVYGQYDCYASLLIKIPSKELTLVLLANNNLMSDPPRLIMGELTSSLFALSFLKNYALGLENMPLFESVASVYTEDFPEDLYRKKVLAQALSESFMARFDPQKMETSAALVQATLDKYPDFLSYGNINLLHNLSFLKDVAFYMDLGDFDQFDSQIEKLGDKLLNQESNNPYLHIYLGTYHDRKGNKEKARFHFQSIVEAKNFSTNWYSREAQSWLDQN